MANANDNIKSFLAGGCAGLVTDVVLFPIDTLKTRLQSAEGLRKSGGFKGIYRGIGSAIAGSMPQAALFFLTYEETKKFLKPKQSSDTLINISATLFGESAACLARMPFEVVKQKTQAMQSKNSATALIEVLKTEGPLGLYKGLGSMLLRDLPFMMIQMPIWEFLKKLVTKKSETEITGFQSGLCGSVAGSIAGVLTCPLDVIKTRIVLRQQSSESIPRLIFVIIKKEGIGSLFSGLVPRVVLISVGGFVFLGMYDQTRLLLSKYID